jgi:hypothetical protein
VTTDQWLSTGRAEVTDRKVFNVWLLRSTVILVIPAYPA